MRRVGLGVSFAAVAAVAAVAALSIVLTPAHAHAAEAATVAAAVDRLATQYMCQCGCGLTLASCTHAVCGPRDRVLGEIRRLVEGGQTPPQITAALVGQYGEQVLAAPPRRGLNLLAWWGPYAALLTGAVVILLLASAWTRRPSPQLPASASALSPEQRRVLEEELRKFDG